MSDLDFERYESSEMPSKCLRPTSSPLAERRLLGQMT
nr:MAG TPA: hypothetical protein [Caudoviricetes sp.]